MTNRYVLGAELAAGIALIALAGILGLHTYRESRDSHTLASSEAAACPANAKRANFDFTLKDTSGRDVKLADFSGKVVLLDFWATWCVPCQLEIPGFVDLQEKYKARGAQVVGIVVMDEFKNVKPFADAHGMTYPVLDGIDRDDVEAAFGPFMGLPTSFVISRDGRICAAHLGVPDVKTPGPTLQKSIEYVFEAQITPLL